MIDWGDGTYENTAATLVEATQVGLDALDLAPGERVLDLGCGTGNAAIEAARRGARVVALDPAPRLVEVAARRAAAAGFPIEARVGGAEAIPAPDGSFDAVVSIFAVIFAPDAEASASEMVRVTRPGGRVVLTSWLPSGPIAEAGKLLRGAMAALAPPSPPSPPPPWGDEDAVRALLEARGARVEIARRTLHFDAPSAEAWFTEQEENHPVWRFVRRALEPTEGAWADLRARSIAALEAGNLAPGAFRAASDYLVVKAVVGAP